jgi:hypothetical protein
MTNGAIDPNKPAPINLSAHHNQTEPAIKNSQRFTTPKRQPTSQASDQ